MAGLLSKLTSKLKSLLPWGAKKTDVTPNKAVSDIITSNNGKATKIPESFDPKVDILGEAPQSVTPSTTGKEIRKKMSGRKKAAIGGGAVVLAEELTVGYATDWVKDKFTSTLTASAQSEAAGGAPAPDSSENNPPPAKPIEFSNEGAGMFGVGAAVLVGAVGMLIPGFGAAAALMAAAIAGSAGALLGGTIGGDAAGKIKASFTKTEAPTNATPPAIQPNHANVQPTGHIDPEPQNQLPQGQTTNLKR